MKAAAIAGDAGSTRHLPALDGIRGFAALCVVLSHAGRVGIDHFVVAGTFGVSLFFSLSGFLMAFLYLRTEWSRAAIRSYAINRFSRIAPLYLLIVVSSFFIHGLLDGGYVYDINRHNLVRHLLFSGNDFVLWSIPPEIQFYVFFVGIWYATQALKSSSYVPLLVLAAVTGAMFTLGPRAPGTTLPAEFAFFLFGAVAGLLATHRTSGVPAWIIALAQLALLPGALAYCITLSTEGAASVYLSLPYAALCALAILCFTWDGPVGRSLFANRPMRMLGAWSFGIYLIHGPCIYVADKLTGHGGWLALVLGAAASLPAAGLLHHFVERPAQSWIKAHANLRSGIRGLATALPSSSQG